MFRKLFFVLSLLLLLAACGGKAGSSISFSTANIKNVTLANDEAGANATTTFAPGDTFYLLVTLANAPDDTTVKAVWTAVSAAGADPNTELDSRELTSGDGVLTFTVANDNPWPDGSYKVDLFLNGKLDRTLEFNVGGGAAAAPASSAATPVSSAPTTPPPANGAVTTLADVKTAVVQIEAEGTFRDPEQGMLLNAAGRGSGFIIAPEGIAITNNHVVAGAALIKVWIGGESEPRNAKILGVSECSDLAVIDIEGDGYPYLTWYNGDLSVGLDVYAAGFPLGDPEYTLTRGIISKERADGETGWASVDYVIQHDATINPGNSGGPLVTADGQVVGVNYAGASSVNQYFSIARDQAVKVSDILRQGQNFESIGVNGRAIADPDNNLYGIWISSVTSGTPADKAGVQPGDIITQLEGLVLATDGTMADYCDILRTKSPEAAMDIEVLRFDTQEVLAGQLNGDSLVQRFSFAQELQDNVAAQPGGAAAAPAYTFHTVTDNSGLLVVDIPEQWSDIDGSPWVIDGSEVGASVTAASSIDGFQNGWTTPGIFFAASASLVDQMGTTDMLDAFDFSSDCQYGGRSDYSDDVFTGAYDLWTGCGGQDSSTFLVLSAMPQSPDFIVLVATQIVSDADLDALDHILSSFNVVSGE